MAAVVLAAIAFPASAAEAVAGREGPALFGIPVDFILFGVDAARRCAVSSSHAAGRARRARGHHALQARLHRLQDRRGPRRPGPAHAARVGHPHQSAGPAARLRAPVQPFREEPRPGGAAALPARRLEGRIRAARHDLRAVELSRQYRGGDDRRHHRRHRVPAQGAYRLSGGDRRRLERRRLGQRGGRHDDHHDVDRRREPGGRAGGLRRGGRRDGRYSAMPAAMQQHRYSPIIKDAAARDARGLEPGRDRRADTGSPLLRPTW